MIKLRGWELTLIAVVVIPLFKRVLILLKEHAEGTPNPYDNYLVGLFEVVIEAFEDASLFGIQK